MKIIHRGQAAFAVVGLAATLCSPAFSAEVTDATTVPLPATIATKAASALTLDITEAGSAIVAVGGRGHVLISNDNGDSWEQQNVPVRTTLIAVDFADAKNGWAVGHDSVIIHTKDGGESWKVENFEPLTDGTAALYGVLAVDANRAFAVGSFGKMRQTTDSGSSWSAVDTSVTDTGAHINDMIKLPSGTLVAVGESGFIATSTDKGGTWSLTKPAYAGSYFGAVPMGNNGIRVFGLQGNAFETPDVAKLATMDPDDFDPWDIPELDDAELMSVGWKRIVTPTNTTIYGGYASDNGDVVMVGSSATIYTLKNGTLATVDSRYNLPIAGVVARDGRIIIAAVDGVHVVKTK
jgi:photosystem II stability/assembly factor-like uncharacterized protein